MEDALYGCYLRVGDSGPWAGPWAGIARLEMPSGIGRAAAVEAAERAEGWLPGFASALHRDAPAHRGRQRCRISEPFAHDSRTAALAGGRPCGAALEVRPRTRAVAARP